MTKKVLSFKFKYECHTFIKSYVIHTCRKQFAQCSAVIDSSAKMWPNVKMGVPQAPSLLCLDIFLIQIEWFDTNLGNLNYNFFPDDTVRQFSFEFKKGWEFWTYLYIIILKPLKLILEEFIKINMNLKSGNEVIYLFWQS